MDNFKINCSSIVASLLLTVVENDYNIDSTLSIKQPEIFVSFRS